MIRLELQILAAMMLDLLLGDPRWLPHPVRAMGWLISRLERLARGVLGDRRIAGAALAAGVVGLSGLGSWAILQAANLAHPLAGDIVSIILIYTCLSARDMVRHSEIIRQKLDADDLPAARAATAMIVSRDTDALDEAGICRSTVESVAENLADGVIAPLLFAVVAGPIGAIVFKAVSTLDSMVGYKNERYIRLGWASAKLDDIANFIPARLTGPAVAIAAALTGGRAGRAMKICWRDHNLHASPNSAWSESAFAGALGIQLGGPTIYDGQVIEHPTLGDADEPIRPGHIRKANRLFIATALIVVAVLLAGRLGIHLMIQITGGAI